jgi:hypothetical protein
MTTEEIVDYVRRQMPWLTRQTIRDVLAAADAAMSEKRCWCGQVIIGSTCPTHGLVAMSERRA